MLLASLVLASGLVVVGVVLAARWLEARAWARSLVAFRLRLPQTLTADTVAQWLVTVNAATHAPRWALLPAPPLVLHLVGSARGIEHFLLMPKPMHAAVFASLRAALPGVRLEAAPEFVAHRPRFRVAAEAGLSNHQRPLGSERAETASAALLAALQPLQGNEEIHVQWIVTGGGIPDPVPSVSARGKQHDGWWLDSAVSVDPEAVHAARLKRQAPLLRAVVRVGVANTANRRRAYSLFGRVWGSLRTLNATGVGVVRRWWLPVGLVAGRMRRYALPLLSRWPLTVNTTELAGLSGLVMGAARVPGLDVGSARQVAPSPTMPASGVVVGMSDYPGLETRRLALTVADRLHHLHLIGPTGTGKSTLLAALALQDIAANWGVVLIDPKGDLVESICDRFPAAHADDLIVLDPSETNTAIVGFNPLASGTSEHERELVVDHVLHVFREIYADFWGPRTDDVLRSALLTLVHLRALNGSPLTLCEVPALLTNPAFRRALGQRQAIPDQLRPFWAWYHGLKPADQVTVTGPVLNKLRAFTDRTATRLMLGQPSGLDFDAILNGGKVLLVSLAKGKLGQETAALIGSLLVASLEQATLRRASLPPAARQPVMVFLDEFQDVLRLGAVGDMLAQARGLGVGLHLAHQHLHQLPRELAHDVLGTARSQVIFQLGHEDARALALSVEPWLTAADLQGLDTYSMVLRPCVTGRTLPPVTGTTLPLPPANRDGRALAQASRDRHGVPRDAVEAALRARLATGEADEPLGRSPRRRRP
jgi:type IV secretion system coupling TraD/TrwB family protein/type IV secretory system conjugative DNA transfer VirD4/TraG family protein